MKQVSFFLISLFVLSCLCETTLAQTPEPNSKFGKIPDSELTMPRYEADTSAHAVVLYDRSDFYYVFNLNRGGFEMIREYETRIKVFDQEGASWGDVNIPYYNSSSGAGEKVGKISAVSYNLENGKVVKKQLEHKNIYLESLSENMRLCKFSIPDVKAGSVIEYKYTVSSDLVFSIPSIKFQQSIPVILRQASVSIPEYFEFSMDTKGYIDIAVDKKNVTKATSFIYGLGFNYFDISYEFTASDIPALKGEPYVWCTNDFRSVIEFELKQFRDPGLASKTQTFSYTWEDVNRTLNENIDFLTALRFRNPYKTEVAQIKAGNGDQYAKLHAIHKMVLSKVIWDGSWSLHPRDIRETLRTGTGSSSDLNFILRSALLAAGYDVSIILLNPREHGRLPYTSPTLQKIGTFILMVTMPDGKQVFLDATDRNSDVNLLPESLTVDRGRILGASEYEGWVDLTRIAKNQITIDIIGSVDETGLFTGQIRHKTYYSPALGIKESYKAAKSEDEYIEQLEASKKITIDQYKITGLDSTVVTQQYDFKLQCDASADRIYINAAGLPYMQENPFTQQKRVLPIEFPYTYTVRVTANITLPEGYVIEEAPSNVGYVDPNGVLKYIFKTESQPNRFSSLSKFELNQIIFPSTEFDNVYTFYGEVANANQKMVVLKKEE